MVPGTGQGLTLIRNMSQEVNRGLHPKTRSHSWVCS